MNTGVYPDLRLQDCLRNQYSLFGFGAFQARSWPLHPNVNFCPTCPGNTNSSEGENRILAQRGLYECIPRGKSYKKKLRSQSSKLLLPWTLLTYPTDTLPPAHRCIAAWKTWRLAKELKHFICFFGGGNNLFLVKFSNKAIKLCQ